jgi:hypothetical protein
MIILAGVSTEYNFHAQNFVKSARKNNFNPILLGLNQPWGGWLFRLRLYIKFLETLPDNQIVLLSDVYDVLVQQSEAIVRQKFEAVRNGKPVVWGVERFPRFWITGDKTFTHINGGLCIGFVSSLKKIFKAAYFTQLKVKSPDDQNGFILALTYYYGDLVTMDVNRQLFWNLTTLDLLQYKFMNKKVVSRKNNNVPAFVHFLCLPWLFPSYLAYLRAGKLLTK